MAFSPPIVYNLLRANVLLVPDLLPAEGKFPEKFSLLPSIYEPLQETFVHIGSQR